MNASAPHEPLCTVREANRKNVTYWRCTECGTEQIRHPQARRCCRPVLSAEKRHPGAKHGICGGELERLRKPPRVLVFAAPRSLDTLNDNCPSFENLRRHLYVIAGERPIIVDQPCATALEAVAVCWSECAQEGAAALIRCLAALGEVARLLLTVDRRLAVTLADLITQWREVLPGSWAVVQELDALVLRVRTAEILREGREAS